MTIRRQANWQLGVSLGVSLARLSLDACGRIEAKSPTRPWPPRYELPGDSMSVMSNNIAKSMSYVLALCASGPHKKRLPEGRKESQFRL
jgi:hypothetical protein